MMHGKPKRLTGLTVAIVNASVSAVDHSVGS